MGSGHFLVGVCRRLSEHLLGAFKARYAEEQERAARGGREAYPHELLIDAGIHAEVARHWGDEPAELTACRQLVAAHCIYGVDLNPLSVELARVSLWLATAASDHPLTFLDHRLVCGNSLLGIKVDHLLRGFYNKKPKKQLTGDDPPQGELPFYFGSDQLKVRLQRAFQFLETIERLETEQPGDFEDQQQAYVAMRQELKDFLDAHALRIGRAFLDENEVAADPLLANEWMREIQDHNFVAPKTRDRAAPAIAKGKEVGAFCWELTFPELFFQLDRSERPGFDAMVGNPPWDTIRAKTKEFFAEFDPAIRDFQGQPLKKRVQQLGPPGSEPYRLWSQYTDFQTKLAHLLIGGGVYEYQVVLANGEKTGGDPDLYKFFLERFHQLIRPSGRAGVLMPAGLCSLEGATGVRRMLFTMSRVEAIFSFENWGKRFFQIHASFKFLTLVFENRPAAEQSFPAAFMLRDENFLALRDIEREVRSVRITSDLLNITNPEYQSLIELRDDKEREFVERIYRSVPRLSERLEGEGTWNVEFHRELHMTDDAWRFRRHEWLLEHGCRQEGSAFVAPAVEWYTERALDFVPGTRYIVPEGAKYRITSEKPREQEQKKRGRRGVTVQSVSGFLLANHSGDDEMPVIPSARYVSLYEGRMVHQFDHAAKGYVSGEGRAARWRDLDFQQKSLMPHYYVFEQDYRAPLRIGICKVTGQTNERTLLSTLLPQNHPSGDSMNALAVQLSQKLQLVWLCVANSVVADFLLRQKVTTNLNLFYLMSSPLIRPNEHSTGVEQLSDAAARLVSSTPEIQLAEPAIDLRERARLRAEIDALVAGLYQLSPVEFANILSTFPLLDRDQPPLPGDVFVRWDKQGKPREEPRSYVTRDNALLAYFRQLDQSPPPDLAIWYRDEVGINMIDDSTCPFRLGSVRSLEARVAEHHCRGAIAYIPSKARKWDPNGPYQPPDLPSDWKTWVIQDHAIRGGALTLKGTRLSVEEVQKQLVTKTFDEIRSSFPQLSDAHIAVALATSTSGA